MSRDLGPEFVSSTPKATKMSDPSASAFRMENMQDGD